MPEVYKPPIESLASKWGKETGETIRVVAETMYKAGVVDGRRQVLQRLDPYTGAVMLKELEMEDTENDGVD